MQDPDWSRKVDIIFKIYEKMKEEIIANKKIPSDDEMKRRFQELANSPDFNLKFRTREDLYFALDAMPTYLRTACVGKW
jgi:hypothetical protein